LEVKGSRLVKSNNEHYLHVTFRKTIEERKAEGILGVDVNERSIELTVARPNKVKFL